MRSGGTRTAGMAALRERGFATFLLRRGSFAILHGMWRTIYKEGMGNTERKTSAGGTAWLVDASQITQHEKALVHACSAHSSLTGILSACRSLMVCWPAAARVRLPPGFLKDNHAIHERITWRLAFSGLVLAIRPRDERAARVRARRGSPWAFLAG